MFRHNPSPLKLISKFYSHTTNPELTFFISICIFTLYTTIIKLTLLCGAWGSTVLLVGLSRDRIPVASVTGIFLVDTDRTMCPGVNSASKKMSTRDSPGGKGGRCVRLSTYHPCSAERQEIRDLNLPGPPWAISTACCGRDLYLYLLRY